MWPFKKECLAHDIEYYYGGPFPWMKNKADSRFYWAMRDKNFYGRMVCKPVYNSIRFGTYNYPPGHPARSERAVYKGKAWNWLGSGMP